MNVLFIGNHFSFPKRVNSIEEIEATIKRCNTSYKTNNVLISRKIKYVVDVETGAVIAGHR
jgi:hypothetical protein